MPRGERDAGAWNLKFKTRAWYFCALGAEKRYVKDRFKACFRNSLRCSRYSSCGRDKLSKIGEFYLHYLCVHKVPVMRFCASAFVVSRVVLGSARHLALWSLCALSSLCRVLSVPIPCASRLRHGAACFGVLRVALYVVGRRRLKFYVRRPVYRSMSSLGTARLSCFASAIEPGSLASALAYAPLCVFCRARATQRPMRAVKF